MSTDNEPTAAALAYGLDKKHTDTEFLIGFNIYLTLYYKFIAQEKKEEIRFYNLFTSSIKTFYSAFKFQNKPL